MPWRSDFGFRPDQDQGPQVVGGRQPETDAEPGGRDDLVKALEHLRKGTREQYESDWVLFPQPLSSGDTTVSRTFPHGLDEVPWIVDILESEEADGARAKSLQPASYVTFTKDERDIIVTRDVSKFTVEFRKATATWNPNLIADGDKEALDVTVNGAALGDIALASFSLDVDDLQLTADVTAANTVTAILSNSTNGNVNRPSGTLTVVTFSPVTGNARDLYLKVRAL